MAFDFPASPTMGQQVTGPGGQIYQWDGTKWVSLGSSSAYAPLASPVFTGDPRAPTPTPGDADTSIATTAFVANSISGLTPSLQNMGRNYLLNALFRIWQHGTTPVTTSAYTGDMWKQNITLDASTASYLNAVDADRTAVGDEELYSILNVAVTGNAGATAATAISQPIEGVNRLSNKQVTYSFWAKASAGTPKIGVSFDQQFGSGGSPSAAVLGNGTAYTLSTTWARYSGTLTLPSVVGKSYGTNADHFTNFVFWLSSGANNNTRSGGVGVQTATFQIWGVQLELGNTPTVLEKVLHSRDLAACQRYYNTGPFMAAGYGVAGVGISYYHAFPVYMRAAPNVTTIGAPTQTNCTGTFSNQAPTGFSVYANASATGGVVFAGTYAASAEL